MLTHDATQQSLVACTYPTISWLFKVDKTGGGTDYWSTKAITFDAQAYTAHIIADSLGGVTLARSKSENHILAPSTLTFDVDDKDNALTPGDYDNAIILASLVISDETDTEICAQWRFRVVATTLSIYQQIRFECEDILSSYLRTEYPKTRLVDEIFPLDKPSGSICCVPEPFGTCYVPLRSVYVGAAFSLADNGISVVASASGANCKYSGGAGDFTGLVVGRNATVAGFTEAANNGTFRVLAVAADGSDFEIAYNSGLVTEAAGDAITCKQGKRYFLLGSPDGGITYTVSEIRSPREFGPKSTYASGSYTFTQVTKADGAAADWRMVEAIIADLDRDGTADAPGLWISGDRVLDPPVKFSRSDTASTTNPADVIEAFLLDLGIHADYIDTGGGSSFAAAETVYDGWSLTFNGAFWYKQKAEEALAILLILCHSQLVITDKIELHVLSKTSQKTADQDDILKGSFAYQLAQNANDYDGGYIECQQSGEAQDAFSKLLVAADASCGNPSSETVRNPFVSDTQDAQRAGELHFQKKLMKQARVSFKNGGGMLAIQPGDVITINHTDYGGNYVVLVDEMTIHYDLSITFKCDKYSVSLDDWGDLAPSAVTFVTDDTGETIAWQPDMVGPLTGEGILMPNHQTNAGGQLVVGPQTAIGQYTDIQEAVNAVALTGASSIFIKNGTYTLTDAIYLPNENIEVIGESRAGVIISTANDKSAFNITDRTKTFRLYNFTITHNCTIGAADKGIYVYGTAKANNTANITLEDITINLAGAGGNATYPVYCFTGQDANIIIKGLRCVGGYYQGITVSIYDDSVCVVRECYCSGMITNPGIMVSGVGGAVIDKNNIEDCKHYGIIAQVATHDSYTLTIRDNVIKAEDSLAYPSLEYFYGIVATKCSISLSGNKILINRAASSGTYDPVGIKVIDLEGGHIRGNSILIDVDEAGTAAILTRGIWTKDSHAVVIGENNIEVDNVDTTRNHYGIYLENGDDHVIQGNHIDLKNNDAKDIGIAMDGNSDNNYGDGNITKAVGTSISDAGAGNNVTAQDI